MKAKTEQRIAFLLILFALIVYVLFYLIEPFFYSSYAASNLLAFHIFLQLLSIVVSFAIALQASFFFPHVMSKRRLQIAALFLSVGFLDLFHALTSLDIIVLTTDSTAQNAASFSIVARLVLAIGLFFIIRTDDHLLKNDVRFTYFTFTSLATLSVTIFIFFQANSLLPTLIIEGEGATHLNRFFGYTASFFIFLSILFLYRKHKKATRSGTLIVLSGLILLFLSSLTFIYSSSIGELENLLGHMYKVIGVFLLFRGFYVATIEEPFIKQKKVEELLESIVETIPSGIVLISKDGTITFVNKTIERILNTLPQKLIGTNILEIEWQFFSKNNTPLDNDFFKKALISTETVREQQLIVIKEEKKYYLSINSAPMYDSAGYFIGTVHAFNDMGEQVKAEKQIEYLAYTDSLTGLPNYYSFMSSAHKIIEKAKLNNEKFALFLLDLDQFKKINDTLGHSYGDFVLKMYAQKLMSISKDDWLISRMGGDEFFLCIPIKNTTEANKLAEKIHSLIQEPFILGDEEFHLTASIGISVFPYDGDNMKTLMKRADIAMFKAKTSRNHFHFYTKEMDKQSLELLILEQHLRKAIKNNELILHYQPQYSLVENKVFGFEALIRWIHPEKGLIAPSVFIPIAEETGIISDLGHWVLLEACNQLKKWDELGYPRFTMSVNLSMRQFNDENLYHQVKQVIDYVKIDPTRLKLEITESMSMNVNYAIETLNKLKQLGVQIVIDDFGTGYSSLSYLKKFPIDGLKIDQSFIRNIATETHNKALVASIITIAQHLQLSVIAEGVETKEELNYLKQLGCPEFQGFYFSKPLPAQEVVELFHKQIS